MKIENENEDINPVIRIEDSIFEGISDINQLNTHIITIEWKNKQKKDPDDDCEFDYRGKFSLVGNRFGFLTDKVKFLDFGMHW